MYSRVIIFVVALVGIIPKNVLGSIKTQLIKVTDDDIHKLLNLVQNQLQDHTDSNIFTDGDSNDSTNASDDAELHNKELRAVNVLDIIGQKMSEKRSTELLNQLLKHKHSHNNQASGYDKNANNHVSGDTIQVLQTIIRKITNNDRHKPHANKRISKGHVAPNRLLGIIKDKKNDNSDINENSLIYLILNAYGLQKSTDRNSVLNTLTSKLLSLPSSVSHNNQENPRLQRKKEHSASVNVERRRGSGEMYGPMDSGEDKPKRARNGIRGAGRTAIPYIRHRGENIYERD